MAGFDYMCVQLHIFLAKIAHFPRGNMVTRNLLLSREEKMPGLDPLRRALTSGLGHPG